jgi:hypothetical protein
MSVPLSVDDAFTVGVSCDLIGGYLLDRMERPGGSGRSVRMVGGLRICVGCRG